MNKLKKLSWFKLENYSCTKHFEANDWCNEIYSRMILSAHLGLNDYGLKIEEDKSYRVEAVLEAIKKYGSFLRIRDLKIELGINTNFFSEKYDSYHSIRQMTKADAVNLINKIKINQHFDDTGTRYITLNLENSNKNLLAGLSLWLDEQRSTFTRSNIKHNKSIFETWFKYQLLALYDLRLIATVEGYESELSSEILADLLYVGFLGGASGKTVRITAQSHLDEMFTYENVVTLYDQHLNSFSA